MNSFDKKSACKLLLSGLAILSVTGCEQMYDVTTSAASKPDSSTSAVSPGPSPSVVVSPSPTSSPKPSPSPSVTPKPSPTPSPSPSPISTPCTQTCEVPNGRGIQFCSVGAAAVAPMPSPGTCQLTQCNPGYVAKDGVCVPSNSVNSFVCTSYSPLTLDAATGLLMTESGTTIPAQDASGQGVCYYYAIYNGPEITGISTLNGTDPSHHDQAVISQDHDVQGHTTNTVWHPYTMNHTNVDFILQGARTLHLTGGNVSGTSFTSSTINIDNFFLVGVYPKSSAVSTKNLLSYYSAWGTADAVIANPNGGAANSVAFNPAGIKLVTSGSASYSNSGLVTQSDYTMVPLNVEGPKGTANVPSVDLTNLINSQITTSLDFRALDCGGTRDLANIFLLFQ